MKYEDYEKVRRLHDEIASLDKDLAYVNGGGNGLGVTIQGRYQDDEIVDQVRPVVAGILTVAKIDRLLKLRSLGIEVGEMARRQGAARRFEHQLLFHDPFQYAR